MKLGIFIGGLSGGGAEQVVCNLANYLSNQGHKVEILTMSDDVPTYELDKRISRLPLLRDCERKNIIYNTILRVLRLYTYLKKNKDQDCYLVMLPVTTILMLILRSATKAKVIVSERNDPASYSALIQKALKLLMRRADGVVFQTLEAKAWYSNSVGDASTVVIPNAVNEDFIRPRYQGERRKEIVAAGRLTDQKNFAMLLNAFSLITKKYPDYELIIYGEGPNRQTLSEQARELGISNKVYFPGYSLELGKKIEAASMFVLSSDYEGMPNVLMEAMALGLPCVSTDCPCGGPRLLIQDGINGILVPVGNAEAMAEAMDKVLSNERFSVQLGQNASKIVERLCPNKIYHEWEQFFLRVLERRK